MKKKPVFLMMLAVLLVFGMVFAGCDTGGGSDDGGTGSSGTGSGGSGGGDGGALVGKWDIKGSTPNTTPDLEFTATDFIRTGVNSLTYTATGTTITVKTKSSAQTVGTADYAINGTELSFSNLNLTASLNAILNYTYTKRP